MILFHMDVLARPHEDFGARVPDSEGMRLWSDLHQTHLGRLGVVVDEIPSQAILEHWLRVNGVKAVIYEVLETTDPQIKAEKVQRLMMSVGIQDWYIDTDPRTVALTLRMGIPSMLIANPYVLRPEWLEDAGGPRPWGELVTEMDSQLELRAARAWKEDA
jgi:hypothetical protein